MSSVAASPEGLAPGSTTAIGSLPHTGAREAVEFVFASGCDIPFWPQLPRRSVREWMVPQFAEAFPGFVLDEGANRFHVDGARVSPEALTAFYERVLDPQQELAPSPEHAAGLFEFLGQLGSRAGTRAFLKGQVTGPLTFLLGLNLADGRPIHADAELRSAALELLARLASWQAKKLGGLAGEGALVFIDEPIYSALGTAAYLSITADEVRATVGRLAEAVRGEGALAGVHCCGEADWETVLSAGIDILSFDSWNYAGSLALYGNSVRAFLERGGVLAWGAVPTGPELARTGEKEVWERLEEAVSALAAKGVPETLLRRRALITPSCGCGSRSIGETEHVFALLRSAGERWRSRL